MSKQGNKDNQNKVWNLIILGNGFDLMLGLPTRFSDFIEFCRLFEHFIKHVDDKKCGIGTYDFDKMRNPDGIIEISKELLETFPYIYDKGERDELIALGENIKKSKLIKFCINLEKDGNYKWNSFEKYLLFLCRSFEEYINNVVGLKDVRRNVEFINADLVKFIQALDLQEGCFDFNVSNPYRRVDSSTFLKSSLDDSRIAFIDSIYKELSDFSSIFNTYIRLFVCKMPVRGIAANNEEGADNALILNFNYTWNEQKFSIPRCNHVHGLTIDNNIIISISSDDMPLEYMKLQKRFMSIFNKANTWFNTDRYNNYYDLDEWINRCQYEGGGFSIYVIGHSLDVIDDYILKKIFNNPSMGQIHLFYHKEASKISLLSNICRIMGYDKVEELITGFPHIIMQPMTSLLSNDG